MSLVTRYQETILSLPSLRRVGLRFYLERVGNVWPATPSLSSFSSSCPQLRTLRRACDEVRRTGWRAREQEAREAGDFWVRREMPSPPPRQRGGLRWPVGMRAVLIRFSSSGPHACFFHWLPISLSRLTFKGITVKKRTTATPQTSYTTMRLHHHASPYIIDKPYRLSYLHPFGPTLRTPRTWRRRESVPSGCIMQVCQFSEQSLPHHAPVRPRLLVICPQTIDLAR